MKAENESRLVLIAQEDADSYVRHVRYVRQPTNRYNRNYGTIDESVQKFFGLQEGQIADFSKLNLSGVDLKKIDLTCTKFAHANLTQINLYKGKLAGVDLSGANLSGACLDGVNLKEANLEGANLFGADLKSANFIGANLRGADLRGVQWALVRLTDADLTGALYDKEALFAELNKQVKEGMTLQDLNIVGLPGTAPSSDKEKGEKEAPKQGAPRSREGEKEEPKQQKNKPTNVTEAYGLLNGFAQQILDKERSNVFNYKMEGGMSCKIIKDFTGYTITVKSPDDKGSTTITRNIVLETNGTGAIRNEYGEDINFEFGVVDNQLSFIASVTGVTNPFKALRSLATTQEKEKEKPPVQLTGDDLTPEEIAAFEKLFAEQKAKQEKTEKETGKTPAIPPKAEKEHEGKEKEKETAIYRDFGEYLESHGMSSLICPLSQKPFKNPVSTADGHVYEKKHIEKWFQGHNTSPNTGEELPNKNVTTSWITKKLVEEQYTNYKKQLPDQEQGRGM